MSEQAILGQILSSDDRSMPLVVQAGVEAEWFAGNQHREIFRAAMELFSTGVGVDPVTIGPKLHNVKASELDDLIDAAGTPGYLEFYLENLRRSYRLRALSQKLMEAQGKISTVSNDEVDTFIGKFQDSISKVGLPVQKTKTLDELKDEIIHQMEYPDQYDLLPWPLDVLNRDIGAIDEELIYLAAKPSVGKTAFGLQFCNYLDQRGIVSSYLSLESSAKVCVGRLMSQRCKINMFKARSNPYKINELKDHSFDGSNIRIEDARLSMQGIMAYAKNERDKGSKLIILDNLKHILCSDKFPSEVQRYMYISSQLKLIRDAVGIPLLVMLHLNEEGKLAWSRDLERDGDIIICMEENEFSTRDNTKVDFQVRKHRNGFAGYKNTIEFNKDIQSFVERS